ncbi:SDR family NAD(P)-dependent oxidoreductase [Streptomyces sp. NPDC058637]|uniref:SDR family NAD(P)-dependent oxidoreductase n=1 Tax=Streptomyces sp. NPDC058637 TaxID=3346569 RepID=UPI0036580DBD
MYINGVRVPVAGATGVLGGVLTAEPAGRGARPALAGRDPGRLARAAQPRPGAPPVPFDAYDSAPRTRAVHGPAAGSGGLDAVVTAFGPVGSGPVDFGRATGVGDEAAEYRMAADVPAPAAFFRAAPGIMRPGSVIATLTGGVSGRPRARTADHSASEAAPRARLVAARPGARTTDFRILDIRPGHRDTGFADRPTARTTPVGRDPHQRVGVVVDATEAEAEPPRTAPDGTPVADRRAR